jgi:hypothetical protein
MPGHLEFLYNFIVLKDKPVSQTTKLHRKSIQSSDACIVFKNPNKSGNQYDDLLCIQKIFEITWKRRKSILELSAPFKTLPILLKSK